uniref:Beta-defensin-like domain-containing protein n=1 Tax=Gopherus evgoodei TaxID=1825980 RepID=A0A8C4W9T1_9SAUR
AEGGSCLGETLLRLLVPSAGLSLSADTLRCISNNGLCHQTLCPRTPFKFGTCSHGRATCCKGRLSTLGVSRPEWVCSLSQEHSESGSPLGAGSEGSVIPKFQLAPQGNPSQDHSRWSGQ